MNNLTFVRGGQATVLGTVVKIAVFKCSTCDKFVYVNWTMGIKDGREAVSLLHPLAVCPAHEYKVKPA